MTAYLTAVQSVRYGALQHAVEHTGQPGVMQPALCGADAFALPAMGGWLPFRPDALSCPDCVTAYRAAQGAWASGNEGDA